MDNTNIEQLLTSVIVVWLLATLFSNGLLLHAFRKVRSLQTPANLLLMNLAVVDLFFICPFALKVVAIYEPEMFPCNRLWGKFFCVLENVVLLNLAAISIERLLAVKISLRYFELVTKRRVKITIAVLWLVSLVIGVRIVLLKIIVQSEMSGGKDFEDQFISHWKANNLCANEVNHSSNEVQQQRRHQMTSFYVSMVMFLLPFVVTIVCHACWVFKISRQHYKRVKAQLKSVSPQMRLQMKHAITTAIVMGSFVILFTPIFILATVRFLRLGKNDCHPRPLKIAQMLLSLQSPWLNPFIYAWRNKDFRKAFWKILKPMYSRLFCCRSKDVSLANRRVQNEKQISLEDKTCAG